MYVHVGGLLYKGPYWALYSVLAVSQRGHGHHFQGGPKNLAHKVLDFRLTFGGETAAVRSLCRQSTVRLWGGASLRQMHRYVAVLWHHLRSIVATTPGVTWLAVVRSRVSAGWL